MRLVYIDYDTTINSYVVSVRRDEVVRRYSVSPKCKSAINDWCQKHYKRVSIWPVFGYEV